MYGKTLPSLTRNTNIDSRNRPQNTSSSNIRNCHGVAQVTAAAIVTVNLPVELKQGTAQESCSNSNTAIVPRISTQRPDMEVVDIEDEFV